MTDDELRALVASTSVHVNALAEAQAKTEAQIAKTEAQMAETDAKLKHMMDLYGNTANNLGAVAEEFYYNSLTKKPEISGIRFDQVYRNLGGVASGVRDEFDIVLVNGTEMFLIEVKHKAHRRDLDKLLNQKAGNFRKLFPLYKDYRMHLGLASFHFHDDLIEECLAEGVTVLQRHGKLIETLAPAVH